MHISNTNYKDTENITKKEKLDICCGIYKIHLKKPMVTIVSNKLPTIITVNFYNFVLFTVSNIFKGLA